MSVCQYARELLCAPSKTSRCGAVNSARKNGLARWKRVLTVVTGRLSARPISAKFR